MTTLSTRVWWYSLKKQKNTKAFAGPCQEKRFPSKDGRSFLFGGFAATPEASAAALVREPPGRVRQPVPRVVRGGGFVWGGSTKNRSKFGSSKISKEVFLFFPRVLCFCFFFTFS